MVKRADFNALMERCRRAEAEVVRLTVPKRPVPIQPPTRPPDPGYILRFPLGRDQWVSVQSNKPLQAHHWDRLTQLLAMQREHLCEPAAYVVLLPDEAGLPGEAA